MQNYDGRVSNVRVAILGAGNICQTSHIPALMRLGVSIVSVTDSSARTLSALRGMLPGSVQLLNTSECEISPKANCALVCTPPGLHAEQVQRLLEIGLHVLCEKPLACAAADAASLQAKAAARGLILQAGYYRRYHPASHAVIELLRNYELGNPIRCIFHGGHVFNSPPAWSMNSSLSGGGVLMDFGVHVFDRLLSWFDAVEIEGYADDYFGGLEANCVVKAAGHLDDHTVPIEIRLSRTTEIGYYSMVEYEDASVTCPLNVGHSLSLDASTRSKRRRRVLVGDLKIGPRRDHVSYFCDQFLEFCDRIGGADQKRSSLKHAVQVNALVAQCYQTRKQMTFSCGW